jgi:hypothetical protein
MRSSQGGGPIPLRIDGKVLPEKAAEREPTALARPACMSGRGVKQEGPRRGCLKVNCAFNCYLLFASRELLLFV